MDGERFLFVAVGAIAGTGLLLILLTLGSSVKASSIVADCETTGSFRVGDTAYSCEPLEPDRGGDGE